VKNLPAAKSNVSAVCDFFKQFGDINNAHMHKHKNACIIKFKEIVSAKKAAQYALTNKIWDDPNVVLIYNTQGKFNTLYALFANS